MSLSDILVRPTNPEPTQVYFNGCRPPYRGASRGTSHTKHEHVPLFFLREKSYQSSTLRLGVSRNHYVYSPPVAHAINRFIGLPYSNLMRFALNKLLRAKRAGAKICAASLKLAGLGEWRARLLSIHRDESKSCRGLINSIERVGGQPDNGVGNFFEKCMAIDHLEERMQLLNRGQQRVVKKIDEIIFKIADPVVVEQLKVMREEHQDNINLMNTYF